MQNLENAPANEVCYHWAYAVDLDGSEYWQLAVLSIWTGVAWQPINIFQQYILLYEVTGIYQTLTFSLEPLCLKQTYFQYTPCMCE